MKKEKRFRSGLHVILLSCLVFAVLLYTNRPGLWVTDEATYALMVSSFADFHSLSIPNGLDLVQSYELALPGTNMLSNGEVTLLAPVPSNLYLLFGVPFYKAFGLQGLSIINIISLCATLVLTYVIARPILNPTWSIICALSLLFTYNLGYSQMVWPHMLSQALIAGSAYAVIMSVVSKDDSGFLPFIGGGLCGIAFGIRMPNILFALAQVAIIYYYKKRGGHYIAGFALPAMATLVANFRLYGNFWDMPYLSNAKYGLYTILFAALAYGAVKHSGLDAKGRNLASGKKAVVFLALAAVLMLFGPLRDYLLKFISKTVFMGAYPGYAGLHKKALLQAIPYLILSCYSFVFGQAKSRKYLILVSSMAGVQFAMMPFTSMGGVDDSIGIRYMLDSLPYLIILSIYCINRISIGYGRGDWAVFGLSFAVGGYIMGSPGSGLFDSDSFLYFFPSALTLGVFALLRYKDRSFMKKAFITVLALSFAYSFCVSVWSLKLVENQKDITYLTSLRIAESIDDGSAVIYPDKGLYTYMALTKLEKDVILVSAFADKGKDLPELMKSFDRKGVKMYFIVTERGGLWESRVRQFIDSESIRDSTFVYLSG